jgi:hypothetical protein
MSRRNVDFEREAAILEHVLRKQKWEKNKSHLKYKYNLEIDVVVSIYKEPPFIRSIN